MNQLLKKAKNHSNIHHNTRVTRDRVEVAVAYMNNEISVQGVKVALGYKANSQITHHMPRLIREGIKQGWVTLKFK